MAACPRLRYWANGTTQHSLQPACLPPLATAASLGHTTYHLACLHFWPCLPVCRYVGVMHQEFLQYLNSMGVAVSPNVTTGNGMDFLVGRVSYTFGLTGPCLRWAHCVGSKRTCCFPD